MEINLAFERHGKVNFENMLIFLFFVPIQLCKLLTMANLTDWLSRLSEGKLERGLSSKCLEYFKDSKTFLPERTAEKVYKNSFSEFWGRSVKEIKRIENNMDPKVSERFEILLDFLDKISQAFDIAEEHENKSIPFSHKLILEGKLLFSMEEGLRMISNCLDDFDRIKDDEDKVALETRVRILSKLLGMFDFQKLQFQIRVRDVLYMEIHEKFLKSYLGIDWD